MLGYVGEIPARRSRKLEEEGLPARRPDRASRARRPRSRRCCAARRGSETIEVDPTGQQVGAPVKVDPGSVGDNVYLTIDVERAARRRDVARAGNRVGAHAPEHRRQERATRRSKAPAGAVVVLDANDGSVVALASYPTYPPSWWVGGISTANYADLTNPASNNPLARPGDRRACTRRARRSSS